MPLASAANDFGTIFNTTAALSRCDEAMPREHEEEKNAVHICF